MSIVQDFFSSLKFLNWNAKHAFSAFKMLVISRRPSVTKNKTKTNNHYFGARSFALVPC